MGRPRRKPAPPGRVHVLCTGRGDPDHDGAKIIKRYQMVRLGDGEILLTAEHGPVIEGYCHRFRCPKCRRNVKVRKERMLPLVLALAEQQGTHGETPVVVDISVIERAL